MSPVGDSVSRSLKEPEKVTVSAAAARDALISAQSKCFVAAVVPGIQLFLTIVSIVMMCGYIQMFMGAYQWFASSTLTPAKCEAGRATLT